jgi:DNA-binding transcriptional MerR regulator
MRVVAQRTGLSPDLVRAWERRYRVVTPHRSAGGQRLYSDEDIEHLRRLHQAVLAGRSISQVAELDPASLAELVDADRAAATAIPQSPVPDEATRLVADLTRRALDAIARLDAVALESVLRHAAMQLTVPVLLDRVIAPLLWEVGDRWEAGSLLPVHEHLASVEVHRLLTSLIQLARVPDGAPVLAIATPAGQLMELGALLVAASAAAEGWRVAWFGPNLPAGDILLAVQTIRPVAVAISLVHQTREPGFARELERLARGIAGHAQLLAGGRAAGAHALLLERLGARVLPDLASLREWLGRHVGR